MTESKKQPKQGYTNPAFKAMGIPTLRFPSRNWLIFWTVLTTSIGGIIYDKRQQKKLRNQYREMVEPLSHRLMDTNIKPRKITVLIAPPPSDYLDTSLKVWRRYVKPILYWGGLDYEIIEEDTQGTIRNEIANRIRELRRQLIEESELKTSSSEKKSKKSKPSPEELEKFDPQQAQQFKNDFDYSKALGAYHKWNNPQVVYQDSLTTDPALSGGVICLGRGAYKEYITGLHEGLLGPLSEPPREEPPREEPPKDQPPKDQPPKDQPPKDQPPKDQPPKDQPPKDEPPKDGQQGLPEKKPPKTEEEESSEDEASKGRKVPPPFIEPDQYGNVEYPHELQGVVRDPNTNCPILPLQSFLVIPIPNLIGFLCIPERIYRFYTKRYFADEVLGATKDVVLENGIRPFENPRDLDICKYEEQDWPKNWVQRGLDRESEWTRKLESDPRVTQQLHVYNKPVEDDEEQE